MQRKRGGNNWIGIVVFLAIVIGPPIANALSRIIFQATGYSVSSDLIIGGIIILAILTSIGVSVARSAGRINSGSETRLPTTTVSPPPMSQPPRPSTPPTMRGPTSQPTKLPGAPKFEPVIDPRILTFGLVGLACFGVIFFAILSFAGGI